MREPEKKEASRFYVNDAREDTSMVGQA